MTYATAKVVCAPPARTACPESATAESNTEELGSEGDAKTKLREALLTLSRIAGERIGLTDAAGCALLELRVRRIGIDRTVAVEIRRVL